MRFDLNDRRVAYGVLALMPLFFSSNLVIGRAAMGSAEPFTLAFLRWFFAFLILLPFAWQGLRTHARTLLSQFELLMGLGILGMWICGALVYEALRHTTASNATLVYTASPVLILILEWAFRGRRIAGRETLGILLALAGVLTIVVQGSLGRLVSLTFNAGDILIAIAALSWAIYSVLLKRPPLTGLPTIVLFAAIALSGAIGLLPFAIWEIAETGTFPDRVDQWISIGGLAFVSSVLAFSSFQYGVKVLGPSVTGVFMYLLPPYGVFMAVFFLGERLALFHLAGFVLVLSGLVLATAPPALLASLRDRLRGRAAAGTGNPAATPDT